MEKENIIKDIQTLKMTQRTREIRLMYLKILGKICYINWEIGQQVIIY